MICPHQKVLLALVCASLLGGCFNPKPPIRALDEAQRKAWFPFLDDGKTTREEAIARLGTQAVGSFDHGHVVTYVYKRSDKGLDAGRLVEVADYELVLVFDTNGVLARHSLLRLR